MKTKSLITILTITLLGLGLTANATNGYDKRPDKTKKAIAFNIDKPIIDFMAKYYTDEIDAGDIIRIQKILSKVDHVTVTFTEADAPDYVFYFKEMDESSLEQWMFDAGYLEEDTEVQSLEPWMMDAEYLE